MSATTPGPQSLNESRFSLPTWLSVWEAALIVLLALTIIGASVTSPIFATGQNFSITTSGALGISLMVIPMTWLIIAGEIDLSIASIFGLSSTIFGIAISHGLSAGLGIALAIVTGGLAGLINGLVAIDIGVPSLIVTVGTLGLYRGMSFILLQNRGISTLPAGLTDLAQNNAAGTIFPYGFIGFVIIAAFAALLLHRGAIGRKVFAVGSSQQVSRFSGLEVKRVKRGLFIFSGIVAAVAGIMYSGYISTVRATNGTGLELIVIGIVLIGGIEMYGGKGSFLGVFLSLALVVTLTSYMTIRNIDSNIQYIVTGLLMITAVVVPAVIRGLRNRRGRSP